MINHVLEGPPDAPVIVLAGSLGSDTTMWEPQVGALSRSLRVLRYDHPGHGGSPPPTGPCGLADLAAETIGLLDELGLERVSFCGLSLGGMVGMQLAAHRPERIDRLVVCASAAHLPPASAWQERADAVRAAGTVEAVADAVLERWFTPGFRAAHPDTVAGCRAMLVATSPEAYAACAEAVGDFDLRDRLGDIAAPTLVIGGREDPATPPPHAEAIAAGVPGARLEVLDNAAHLLNVEQKEAVSELILEHVSTR